ncbi:hypothetical protein SDRG_13549 [Saprolegnia diclina VS20]|uniref:FYVE-type domain-containing protein n=1 Tax=Saprolegnia diclina (strain VS20) TaxID=1156394 RepID=T0RG57_SAPDV|nr:hypothetical protein SDRG_13549 [Saprolegnia diclina VS20]EQC28672.1 hypothetical protein SDRG_13549 [Saprolegnia diclina VS20]|eukprot:XP_008617864.1 hypothetical protein SDRG_13549 [Saprolegnia diclina VS20]
MSQKGPMRADQLVAPLKPAGTDAAPGGRFHITTAVLPMSPTMLASASPTAVGSPSSSAAYARRLPPTETPLLHLTDGEKREYASTGHRVCAEFIKLAALSRDTKVRSTTRDAAFCRQTSTLSNVPSLQAYIDRVHPTIFDGLDATMHVCTIEDADDGNRHHIRLQWGLIHVPWGHDREFTYLEIQRIFVDDHGHRGYARCLYSVPLSIQLTPVKRLLGTLHHSGIVVKETSTPGVLEEVVLVNMALMGHVPLWMTNIVAKTLLKRTCQLQRSLIGRPSTRRISIWTETDTPSTTTADATKKLCKRCTKPLAWFRLKAKCAVCLEIVCRDCSTHWDILWNKSDRVCRLCHGHVLSMQAKTAAAHAL